MKVRRYYGVTAPRGARVHYAFRMTEGYKTFCGRTLQLGWRWYKWTVEHRRARHEAKNPLRRCAQCDRLHDTKAAA
jgi:hypothetical protein